MKSGCFLRIASRRFEILLWVFPFQEMNKRKFLRIAVSITLTADTPTLNLSSGDYEVCFLIIEALLNAIQKIRQTRTISSWIFFARSPFVHNKRTHFAVLLAYLSSKAFVTASAHAWYCRLSHVKTILLLLLSDAVSFNLYFNIPLYCFCHNSNKTTALFFVNNLRTPFRKFLGSVVDHFME